MSGNTQTALELLEQLDALIEQFANLHDHLISERAALRADDRELLHDAVVAKQLSLSAIHSMSKELETTQVAEQIASAPPNERPKLEQRQSLLIAQAANAKEYNAVNGKIIARSQQSLEALTQLLSPGADELIYSERGKTSRPLEGTAYAKA